MRLPGKISINRTSSNQRDDYMTITVEDADSSTNFCTLEMSLHDFAMALTGMGCVGCDLDVIGIERVGLTMEVKREIVRVPDFRSAPEIIRSAVEQFESDGWEGQDSDALNQHNSAGARNAKGDYGYWVTFRRYVSKKIE